MRADHEELEVIRKDEGKAMNLWFSLGLIVLFVVALVIGYICGRIAS